MLWAAHQFSSSLGVRCVSKAILVLEILPRLKTKETFLKSKISTRIIFLRSIKFQKRQTWIFDKKFPLFLSQDQKNIFNKFKSGKVVRIRVTNIIKKPNKRQASGIQSTLPDQKSKIMIIVFFNIVDFCIGNLFPWIHSTYTWKCREMCGILMIKWIVHLSRQRPCTHGLSSDPVVGLSLPTFRFH